MIRVTAFVCQPGWHGAYVGCIIYSLPEVVHHGAPYYLGNPFHFDNKGHDLPFVPFLRFPQNVNISLSEMKRHMADMLKPPFDTELPVVMAGSKDPHHIDRYQSPTAQFDFLPPGQLFCKGGQQAWLKSNNLNLRSTRQLGRRPGNLN